MRVRVPNCRKAVEYTLQQQVKVFSGMINDKEYLDGTRNPAYQQGFKFKFPKHGGTRTSQGDRHRDRSSPQPISHDPLTRGFALVVSAIQFHFIKNCTPVDFNSSDNPVVYFPQGQQPKTLVNPINFGQRVHLSLFSQSQRNIASIITLCIRYLLSKSSSPKPTTPTSLAASTNSWGLSPTNSLFLQKS